MKSLLFFTCALAMLASPVQAQSCAEPDTWLSARYETRITVNEQTRTSHMQLWRKPNNVAHQFEATDITQAWQSARPGIIKPTRYFDAHQRAIEYQPGERLHGQRNNNWSQHYQLISNELLQAMKLQTSTGKGCTEEQQLHLRTDSTHYDLTWIPALKLVKSLTISRGDHTYHWDLQQASHNRQKINHFFAIREQYQSTDYADIGDDHTDPFLTRMVHQGFLEAGASGFYQADGKPLGGVHQH